MRLSGSLLLVIATVVFAAYLCGCSRSATPGIFITQSPNGVDMLDLTEAPAGHLTGTLVISTINKTGKRNDDVVKTVSGSLYKNNISLQIGTKGIFTNPVNAIGTLAAGEIQLDIGGGTQTFEETTRKKYAIALILLDHSGLIVKQKLAAVESMKNFEDEMTHLDSNLQAFVAWGNNRIAHVSNLQQWYAGRLTKYNACINFVRPLAARHVPSWKWQSCILELDNDSYNCQQMISAVRQVRSEELTEEQDLNARIMEMPKQVSTTAQIMDQACSLASTSVAGCKSMVKEFTKGTPSSSQAKHIEEYKAILPSLRDAVEKDTQVAADGEKKLSLLRDQGDAILRTAR